MAAIRSRRAAAAVRGALEPVAALAGFTALAVVVTWPLAANLDSIVIGTFPNDAAGGIANLWRWHEEGGYRLIGTTESHLTGAPLGWERGNALNLQWLLVYLPAYLITPVVGEVAAFNLVVLTGFALSGASMYLLVRWLGCRRFVAAWAGFAYVVFPWHLERAVAGHASLTHLEVFPLLVLAVLAWARRPGGLRAGAIGAVVLAAWLTSGIYGAMAVIAVCAMVPVATWCLVRPAVGTRPAFRRLAAALVAPAAATLLVGAVAALGSAASGLGSEREIESLWKYGARPWEFVLPAGRNLQFGEHVAPWISDRVHGSNPSEVTLFVGWLTLVLAAGVVAAVIARRAPPAWRPTVWVACVLVAAGIAFSLPSPIELGGRAFVHTPSWFAYQLLPQFRVPSRLVVLVVTGLVVLAALGLERLTMWATRGTSGRKSAIRTTEVCLAALAISALELPIPLHSVTWDPSSVPRYVADVEGGKGIVAEYPLARAESFRTSEYLFRQRVHRRPLVNGSGDGTGADKLRRALVDPAGRGTVEALALLGVETVVTRPTVYDYTNDVDVPEPTRYGGLQLVARYPDGTRVWKVVAEPAPAVAVYSWRTVDEPRPPRPDGFIGSPVREQLVRVILAAPRHTEARLGLRARAPRGEGCALRIGDRTRSIDYRVTGQETIRVPVEIPRGRSELLIDVTPSCADEDSPNARLQLGSPWFEPIAGGTTMLHPRIVSRDPGF